MAFLDAGDRESNYFSVRLFLPRRLPVWFPREPGGKVKDREGPEGSFCLSVCTFLSVGKTISVCPSDLIGKASTLSHIQFQSEKNLRSQRSHSIGYSISSSVRPSLHPSIRPIVTPSDRQSVAQSVCWSDCPSFHPIRRPLVITDPLRF